MEIFAEGESHIKLSFETKKAKFGWGRFSLFMLKSRESTRTQVVDGSNESLEHADEDLDTLLRKYSPLQKIFKKSSVQSIGNSF